MSAVAVQTLGLRAALGGVGGGLGTTEGVDSLTDERRSQHRAGNSAKQHAPGVPRRAAEQTSPRAEQHPGQLGGRLHAVVVPARVTEGVHDRQRVALTGAGEADRVDHPPALFG